MNSDQGSQYTSDQYIHTLTEKGIQISMDHTGRCFDNIFTERLWRSVKYDEVYCNEYQTVHDAYEGIGGYFETYNNHRRHQALGYQRPADVYFGRIN